MCVEGVLLEIGTERMGGRKKGGETGRDSEATALSLSHRKLNTKTGSPSNTVSCRII